MLIKTIQIEKNVHPNIKKIVKSNFNFDVLVLNYGNVESLNEYNIDSAINLLWPLKPNNAPLVIEASFTYFFDGGVSDIQYTTTFTSYKFKFPFWFIKKYMIRSVFHYSIDLYIEEEVLVYDSEFIQEKWKFYDLINDDELYKNIFAKSGPKEYKVTKTHPELGFYQAVRNPYYIHPPEPDSCKLCKYYARSAFLHCTVNPSLKQLCRDYVRI